MFVKDEPPFIDLKTIGVPAAGAPQIAMLLGP
jgi:hypothetical protein